MESGTSEERKYCVYLITNLVNGKQYAGKTCRTVKERWNEHRYSIPGKTDSAFLRALRKHGACSFNVQTVLEGVTKDQADQEERRLIRTLNLMNRDFGYNMTEGGDGPAAYYAFSEKVVELYLSGVSSNDIAKEYGCNPTTILRYLKDRGIERRTATEAHRLAGPKVSAHSSTKRHDVPDYLIARLYTEGWNSGDLAKYFSMDRSSIIYRLETQGIARRQGVNHISGRTRDRKFEDRSECDAYIQSIRESEEGLGW